jgi:hypothetical protein
MMTVKVHCGCGQHYAFDVEPAGGRMPTTVACPVCGVDGTAAANEIIAKNMPTQPAAIRLNAVAAPAVAPPMAAPAIAAPPAAPSPAATLASRLAAAQSSRNESEGEKWKWWYFVLAGICFGGYAIWQAYTQHRLQPLGELFFAVLCIAIGIWDFQHKRNKKKRMQGGD